MPAPAVTITYCTGCNWLLRAGWLAQELLSSFGEDLGSVTLVPGSGGIFEIALDGTVIWERKHDGGFPGAAELKRRIRDRLWPDREMGHLDRAAHHDDPISRRRAPGQMAPGAAASDEGRA